MRTPRFLSIAAAAVTTISLLAPGTAVAGPDDGKVLATRTHIDAPKTFWANDTFKLRTNLGEGKTVPAEDSVVWVGKGWGGKNGKGANQYQFTVPEDPNLSFLGEPGDVVYAAPSNILGSHDPVWLGFGADTNLPADTFRDGTACLDLVNVEGPGRVDLFTWYDDPAGFRHLLSSAEDGPRSSYLTPGAHTHNYTTFTRPGRYELTFRSVARSKDGKVISSKLTTLPIQVGGESPTDTPSTPTKERYDAAPAGDAAAAGYELSVAPKSRASKDGDENLSTLTFTAKDAELEGTLTLFINGYFLTDLEVKGGTASWDELLGVADSSIQAVFTPAGANGARWISPALNYTHGATEKVTSAQGAGEYPTPVNDPTNTELGTTTYTPTDLSYTATVDPLDEGYTKVTVDFADRNIRGFVRGGMYDSPEATGASEPIETFIEDGHAEYVFYDDSSYEGYDLRLTLLPHPTVDADGTTFSLSNPHAFGEKHVAKGTLGEAAAPKETAPKETAPKESTPTQPTNEQPAPKESAPNKPAPSGDKCAARPILDRGHIDIRATGGVDKLGLIMNDETGLIERTTVERKLDDVILAARDNARMKRKDSLLMDPSFDFLGPEGSTFYNLPQTQNSDIVWPGYNTMGIDYGKFDGTLDLHLEKAEAPEGGDVALFLTSGLGDKANMLLNTASGDTTVETTFSTHTHTNWAFTKPGIYVLNTWWSATTKDGKELKSDVQKLTVAIGTDAVEQCTEKDNAETPRETEKPSEPSEPSKPSETEKPSEPSKPSETEKPSEPSEPSEPAPENPAPDKPAPNTSSVSPAGVTGIVMAALFGVSFIAFFAQHGPAIVDWFISRFQR